MIIEAYTGRSPENLGFLGKKKRKREEENARRLQAELAQVEAAVNAKMARLSQLENEGHALDTETELLRRQLGLSGLGIVDSVVEVGKGLLSKIGGRLRAAKAHTAELTSVLAQYRTEERNIDALIAQLERQNANKRAQLTQLKKAMESRPEPAQQTIRTAVETMPPFPTEKDNTKMYIIGGTVLVLTAAGVYVLASKKKK